MTKPLKSIPCVDIPIKFLKTPFVSELHPEIIEWFTAQQFVWKLSYISGQYTVIFSEHSEALRFKLRMGHWEDTLPAIPDYLSSSGTITANTLLMQNPVTWTPYITTIGTGGGSGSIGTISGTAIGIGGAGGSAGDLYSSGTGMVTVSASNIEYMYDFTNGNK